MSFWDSFKLQYESPGAGTAYVNEQAQQQAGQINAGMVGAANATNDPMAMRNAQWLAAQNHQQAIASANQQRAALYARAQEYNAKTHNDAVLNLEKGLLGGGSGIMAMSDVRAKENIHPANGEVRQFMDTMAARQQLLNAIADYHPTAHEAGEAMGRAGAHAYEYTPRAQAQGQPPGTHYGPMAQELERTPAGASTVVQAPDGTKHVDTSKLAMLHTSALADLHNRVQRLEQSGGDRAAAGMAERYYGKAPSAASPLLEKGPARKKPKKPKKDLGRVRLFGSK